MKNKKWKIMVTLTLVSIVLGAGILMAQQPIIGTSSIHVLYPNGGEVLKIGATYRISWNAPLHIQSVGIQLINYSRNLIYTIATGAPNTGSYLWQVAGGVVPASGYVIKIYATAQPSIFDVSNGLFTIERGEGYVGPPEYQRPGWRPETEVIKVTSPLAGESWYKTRKYTIRWEAPYKTKYVNLFISVDDGKTYSRIDMRVRARNKRYYWRVPKDFYSSPNCRIKVVDTDNPYFFGTSARFTILKYGESIEPIFPEATFTPPPPTPIPPHILLPTPVGINVTPTPAPTELLIRGETK